MKFTFTNLLLLIFLVVNINAQEVKLSHVAGKVYDSETGAPLVGASVYFAQTTIGTYAKTGGAYSIDILKGGSYELVVSMVGYEIQRKNIFVTAGKNYEYNFKLTPHPVELSQVDVEGKVESDWERNYEYFKNNFLGRTPLSGFCEIQDAEYINFKWEGNVLTANDPKPITVINKYLGYKIICMLLHYSYDHETTKSDFSISPRYVELTPENEEQKNEWIENRLDVYLGSPEHFLWALKHNRLKEEKFSAFFISSPNSKEVTTRPVESMNDILYEEQFGADPVLYFPDYLKVEFCSQRTSYIQMKVSFFIIDNDGITNDHLPFLCIGYWGEFGLANMLPRDYLSEIIKNK